MSLVPAHRRALAQIEESLRRSDPMLDSMLTRFRLPISRGGWTGPTRRLARIRPFIPPAVAVLMLALLVLTIVLSPTATVRCGTHGGPRSAVAAQLRSCARGAP